MNFRSVGVTVLRIVASIFMLISVNSAESNIDKDSAQNIERLVNGILTGLGEPQTEKRGHASLATSDNGAVVKYSSWALSFEWSDKLKRFVSILGPMPSSPLWYRMGAREVAPDAIDDAKKYLGSKRAFELIAAFGLDDMSFSLSNIDIGDVLVTGHYDRTIRGIPVYNEYVRIALLWSANHDASKRMVMAGFTSRCGSQRDREIGSIDPATLVLSDPDRLSIADNVRRWITGQLASNASITRGLPVPFNPNDTVLVAVEKDVKYIHVSSATDGSFRYRGGDLENPMSLAHIVSIRLKTPDREFLIGAAFVDHTDRKVISCDYVFYRDK